MRVLTGQIIATTQADAFGERLSYDELARLFSGMPSEFLICDNHNLAKPIGKASNKSLVCLSNGEWAIQVDVCVEDDARTTDRTGFSIAFERVFAVADPTRQPELRLALNPRHFEENALEELQRNLPCDGVNVGLSTLTQRGLVATAVVVVLTFAGKAIAEQVIQSLGSATWEAFRRKLAGLPFRTKSGQTGLIQLHGCFPEAERPYEIVVEIAPRNETEADFLLLRVDGAKKLVDEVVAKSDVRLVCVTNIPGEGTWRIKSFVDRTGITHEL